MAAARPLVLCTGGAGYIGSHTAVELVAAGYDVEIANAPLQEKSMDHPRADEAEWVVLLEGADAASVGTAARTLFTLAALKPFGVTAAPAIGTYRLLYGNQR